MIAVLGLVGLATLSAMPNEAAAQIAKNVYLTLQVSHKRLEKKVVGSLNVVRDDPVILLRQENVKEMPRLPGPAAEKTGLAGRQMDGLGSIGLRDPPGNAGPEQPGQDRRADKDHRRGIQNGQRSSK